VPGVRDTDKANVFRLSVDYMGFLRSQFEAEDLAALDARFCEQVSMKQLSDQSAGLTLDGMDSEHGSRPGERPSPHHDLLRLSADDYSRP